MVWFNNDVDAKDEVVPGLGGFLLGSEKAAATAIIRDSYGTKEVYKFLVGDSDNNLGIKIYDGHTAEIFLYFDSADHLRSVVRLLEKGVRAETTREFMILRDALGPPGQNGAGRGWLFGGANGREFSATVGLNPATETEQIGFATVRGLTPAAPVTVTGSPCNAGVAVDYELDTASPVRARRILAEIQEGSGQGRTLRATVRHLCEDPHRIFARRDGVRIQLEVFACRLMLPKAGPNLGIVPASDRLRQRLLDLRGKQFCVQGRVFASDASGTILIEDATEAE